MRTDLLELATVGEDELAGPNQAEWLERLEWELDNIRAALDWLLSSGRVEEALRAVSALERFWRGHAHVSEARRWLALGLALSTGVSVEVRAAALRTAAQQATAQSDWDAAVPLLEEAIELFRECDHGADEVVALSFLGFVSLRRDDPRSAAAASERALTLARQVGDAKATSFALMSLGDVCWVQGEHDKAITFYEEAVELRRGLGDLLLISDAVYNLGMAAFQGGDIDRARRAFEDALGPARELGDVPHIAAAQFMLANLDLLDGNPALAAERARESLSLYTTLEDDRSSARCLVVLAGSASAEGAVEEAARLIGAAEALRRDDAPDGFELPILEEHLPKLETALSEDRLSSLKAEGMRLRETVTTREVVSAGVKE